MSIRALCLSGFVAAFAATSALPADYNNNRPPPRTEQQQQFHPHHAGLRLPRPLKVMWRREERAHVRTLPAGQRRGWMRKRWAEMSDQQKRAKIVELQAKWNALPENVRQMLVERKRERRTQRTTMASPRHHRAGMNRDPASMQQSP
jgi:hypothetical protein